MKRQQRAVPSRIEAYERQVRIARAVCAKLRSARLSVEWLDIRTVSGFRLQPVNMRAYGTSILCRPVGYSLSIHEKVWMRQHRPCYVQWGAVDVGPLIAHLTRLSTARNPFDTP